MRWLEVEAWQECEDLWSIDGISDEKIAAVIAYFYPTTRKIEWTEVHKEEAKKDWRILEVLRRFMKESSPTQHERMAWRLNAPASLFYKRLKQRLWQLNIESPAVKIWFEPGPLQMVRTNVPWEEGCKQAVQETILMPHNWEDFDFNQPMVFDLCDP